MNTDQVRWRDAKLKYLLLDTILGIGFPLLFTFILLSPLMLQSGIPFYGDETYYYTNLNSFYFNPSNLLFQWIPAREPAPPFLTLFSHYIPLFLFVNLFGQEIAVKLFILIVASLPGTLTYFASKILANEWFFFKDKKSKTLFSFISALIMLLPFTNSGLIGAATAPTWSYITLPLSFALLVRYLKKGSVKDILSLCIVSLFAIANPFWFYLIAISGFVYIIVEAAFSRKRAFALFKRSAIIALSILLIHTWWLIPITAAYVLGAGGIAQIYTTEKLISFEGLKFLSHWRLLDVMMVGEREYYFFWLHPQNYGPLNVAIPILASLSILVFRKNKYVITMALILVIGIFLTKGAHEPGGYLYYLIASNLPYGAGAILRNPTKFAPLVIFSYAFLIGLFIAKVYEKLGSFKLKRSMIFNIFRWGVITALALLVLIPITYGTILDLQGYTWTRYKPTYVPQIYHEINDWLSKQPDNFKVMWIPIGGAYIWKPYIITAFPDLLSSKPAVAFTKIYPEPLNTTDHIGMILTVLGVKYVIYHGDSISYDEKILENLLRQKDLKIVRSLQYIYEPEDDSRKPLPINQPGFRFQDSPFELVEPAELPRGKEVNLTIKYTIPQDVIDQGYKGRFWAGFNIAINGFPAGSIDISRRVFWAATYEQRMIDDKSGYAVFKVKVPYAYPGTAIDIYANFYDGGFKPLTPSYFIARLYISPKEITVPFIIFQNENYKGPIYIAPSPIPIYDSDPNNLSDIEQFDRATIIDYKWLSPVEWEVTVNASSPFILVFTEPYDKLWRAYVGNNEIKPTPIYNMVNGFAINQTGIIKIRLYYTLQSYFNFGVLVSLSGALFLALLAFRGRII